MDNATEPTAGRDGRILVTGGTGTLGRLVVPRLRDAWPRPAVGRRTWEDFLAAQVSPSRQT